MRSKHFQRMVFLYKLFLLATLYPIGTIVKRNHAGGRAGVRWIETSWSPYMNGRIAFCDLYELCVCVGNGAGVEASYSHSTSTSRCKCRGIAKAVVGRGHERHSCRVGRQGAP